MTWRDRTVVVLKEPQNAANLGAVVRVMKNYGLTNLRLINPAPGVLDGDRIDDLAHRSIDITRRIDVYASLDTALADASYVVGTTARPRQGEWTVETPRQAAPDLVQRARTEFVAATADETYGTVGDLIK